MNPSIDRPWSKVRVKWRTLFTKSVNPACCFITVTEIGCSCHSTIQWGLSFPVTNYWTVYLSAGHTPHVWSYCHEPLSTGDSLHGETPQKHSLPSHHSRTCEIHSWPLNCTGVLIYIQSVQRDWHQQGCRKCGVRTQRDSQFLKVSCLWGQAAMNYMVSSALKAIAMLLSAKWLRQSGGRSVEWMHVLFECARLHKYLPDYLQL